MIYMYVNNAYIINDNDVDEMPDEENYEELTM